MKTRDLLFIVSLFSMVIVIAFIVFPLIKIITGSPVSLLKSTMKEKEVIHSIWLSIYTSGLAALISFIFGTPLAYLLSRTRFFGKRFIESIIDIPIVIPHPVVGIAVLSVVGKNYLFGRFLSELGVQVMGSITGIVIVLTFVALPFYINSAKEGFENVSIRLERVSRSLGASMFGTFFRITLPLARRSILVGFIMALARSISEFGAVVIVAYHPMVASVLIYERFESYGLKYSLPVAFWLVSICLILFLVLRVLTMQEKKNDKDRKS